MVRFLLGRFAACSCFVLVAEVSLPVGGFKLRRQKPRLVLGSFLAELRLKGNANAEYKVCYSNL